MNGEPDSVEELGRTLSESSHTIAVAESCTGGGLGARLTGVSGASEYFIGGVISYQKQTKRRFLAIPAELLEEYGPVSAPVARNMAQHVRDEAGADWGVSTTGYAGPEGGTATEPVGSVYIGIAHADLGTGADAFVEHHEYQGDRASVRDQIVDQAIRSTLNVLTQLET